jgi:protein subunit release factor B
MADFNDGLFRTQTKFQPHEGKLYASKTQINEDAILAANAEKRKMEQRKMDWGRQVASIPQIVYSNWLKANPELRSPDKAERDRTLLRLIRENPQYMVVDPSKV